MANLIFMRSLIGLLTLRFEQQAVCIILAKIKQNRRVFLQILFNLFLSCS